MKYLLLSCLAAALSLQAGELLQIEGTLVRESGGFIIKTPSSSYQLLGINVSNENLAAGDVLRIEGEHIQSAMDVHRVELKTASGFKAVYDWKAVNEELYGE